MWFRPALLTLGLYSGLGSCPSSVFGRAQITATQDLYRPRTPLGLDEYYPVPQSNPVTRDKIELGRRLFHDPLLSLDRTVACASCHRPAYAFSDTVPFSRGVHSRTPIRNTPSIMNRAYGKAFIADGRAISLEETVLQPIENEREMGLALTELVQRLRDHGDYPDLFATVFDNGVTESNIGRALATYVRTLRSGGTPFDRFMAGDTTALSPEARTGFRLFIGKGGCVVCHQGPNFSDFITRGCRGVQVISDAMQ